MTETLVHKGTVSFVNYEKRYATIEYKQDNRKKSVSFKFEEPAPGVDAKTTVAKSHYFRVGDEVNFTVGLTGRGDKLTAFNIKFLYNTALEILINKANTDNNFIGYFKEADDRLFIKEINSYLFFPLSLSQWEKWPDPQLFNEQVTFRLIHTDNIKKLSAELFTSEFIPGYKKVLYHFNRKEPLEAIVAKVSPYAIYLNLAGEEVQAKIPLEKDAPLPNLQPGDKLMVQVNFISKTKIVVSQVISAS